MKPFLSTVLLLSPVLAIAQSPAPTTTTVGEVSFPNSGSSGAQSDFLHGLAQLHNFEYEDAAKHFRRAEELEPNFAMAYWGEAMTKNHGVWHDQDRDAARAALQKLAPTPEARQAKAPTQREKEYLATIEILYGEGSKDERDQKYEAAMATLHQNFPDDIDATAFYALSILSSAEHGRDFATYMRAAAVLEEVFPQHPHHPGVVHYLIHSYDDPIHAPLGLRAARIYAQLAPDAGHAQHMTSHIFLALGMWENVVKANETAIAVVNRQRAATGRPPRACGHYPNWLEYGYMQLGRVSDARRVLQACREEALRQAARDSQSNHATVDSDNSSIGSYAEMRANFLIDSELWQDEVARWTFPTVNYPFAQLTFDYTGVLVAYKSSNLAAAHEALSRAESDFELAKAGTEKGILDEPDKLNNATILIEQSRALLSSSKSSSPEVIAALKTIAAKERGLPLEFGPPVIYKPTDELLGELYLQEKLLAQAQQSFESDLARAPGRRLGTQGLAASAQQILPAKTPGASAKPAAPDAHVHN
jgi:tetratricopeptide (TPR) repeat protein